uniref:Heat shock cognate 71 kDa protein n=1 Tax=Cacopsylla melanoneura TaxID=428564 RepID=A0A8D9A351_9HEMI
METMDRVSSKTTDRQEKNSAMWIGTKLPRISYTKKITDGNWQHRSPELNADLCRGTMEPVEKSLRDAKMDKAQLHDIVLVGRSTRIPKVNVSSRFGLCLRPGG